MTENTIINSYYKDNLAKLGTLKKYDSIKIKIEGKETHYFSLNKDSLKALKEYINKITI